MWLSNRVDQEASTVRIEAMVGCIVAYIKMIIGSKELRKDRSIVGTICIVLAIWMFIAGTTGGTIAPTIAVAVLGVILVVISRRRG